MTSRILALVTIAVATGACAKKKTNDAAPLSENIVYGVEFAQAKLAWRDGSHRVMIGFTDELNQSDEGVDKFTVAKFCDRVAGARTEAPVVHLVWSGSVDAKGRPSAGFLGNGIDDLNEDPFRIAECAGGTTQAVESDASDMDLSTLAVTKALEGTALLEYVTDEPDVAKSVTVTIATATADGETTQDVALPTAPAADSLTAESDANKDIPADELVEVPAPTKSNVSPKAQFSQADGNPRRVRVNLLGLVDPTTGGTIQLEANKTVFVSEDGSREQKGLKVTQSAANALPVDLVFVIDNSGSMGEEADKVADKVKAFAAALAAKGIDARFGVVGIDGDVTGAVNLTSRDGLDDYLGRSSGTSRTIGFGGDDASALEEAAKTFDLAE
jgi:hypothetical protein